MPEGVFIARDVNEDLDSVFIEASNDEGLSLGSLLAHFDRSQSEYEIGLVGVNDGNERQGIGSALVACATEHAKELGSQVITSELVTEAGVGLMTKLFGEESVVSLSERNYDGSNRSLLYHKL